MKNKTRYSKAPADIAQSILKGSVIKDVLPTPNKLVFGVKKN